MPTNLTDLLRRLLAAVTGTAAAESTHLGWSYLWRTDLPMPHLQMRLRTRKGIRVQVILLTRSAGPPLPSSN